MIWFGNEKGKAIKANGRLIKPRNLIQNYFYIEGILAWVSIENLHLVGTYHTENDTQEDHFQAAKV